MAVDQRVRSWSGKDFPWKNPSHLTGCQIIVGDTGSVLEGLSDVFSLYDVALAAVQILQKCARDQNFGWGGSSRVVRTERLVPPRKITGIIPIYVQDRAGTNGYLQSPGDIVPSNATIP